MFSDRFYKSKFYSKVFLIINFTLTLVFKSNYYRSKLHANTSRHESSCLPPNLSLVIFQKKIKTQPKIITK